MIYIEREDASLRKETAFQRGEETQRRRERETGKKNERRLTGMIHLLKRSFACAVANLTEASKVRTVTACNKETAMGPPLLLSLFCWNARCRISP